VVATASESSEVLESNAFRGIVASTWLRNGQSAVVRGRQMVIEGAKVTPHPARDG